MRARTKKGVKTPEDGPHLPIPFVLLGGGASKTADESLSVDVLKEADLQDVMTGSKRQGVFLARLGVRPDRQQRQDVSKDAGAGQSSKPTRTYFGKYLQQRS